MLEITVPAIEKDELWDERLGEFIEIPAKKEHTLQLEHSLISISKWESKWHKPFFSKKEKTEGETIDYIRCMLLSRNTDKEVIYRIAYDKSMMDKILTYIEDPMTATTFSNNKQNRNNGMGMTSEVIYYLMFANGIPLECEKWHINRLITLIRVFSEKNAPSKKMNKAETAKHYAALNAARRKQLNTKG